MQAAVAGIDSFLPAQEVISFQRPDRPTPTKRWIKAYSQPLWLVDIVRGVIDVGQPAADDIAGQPCRRFAAHADLLRAADAVAYQMAVPPGMEKVDDMRRIPVEVWVGDDGYIRRVRHTSGRPNQPYGTSTLDLTELGVELPLDWSQLPGLPTLDASPDEPHLVAMG
ncbi:MAG: hypothetical protein WKF94_12500 [Solirubrobacteraceae bacterium]